MTIEEVKSQYDERKEAYIAKKAKQESTQDRIDRYGEDLEQMFEGLDTGQQSVQFLNDIANSRRGQMKSRIEGILTEAIQLIYGLEYTVTMQYSTKRNRSHLDFNLVKETANGPVSRNMSGFGGGIADAISVPLRLLVLMGSKQTAKVCVLDECYKMVAGSRAPLVAEFLKDISEKLGIQLIMATHQEAVKDASDNMLELENVAGRVRLIE